MGKRQAPGVFPHAPFICLFPTSSFLSAQKHIKRGDGSSNGGVRFSAMLSADYRKNMINRPLENDGDLLR